MIVAERTAGAMDARILKLEVLRFPETGDAVGVEKLVLTKV